MQSNFFSWQTMWREGTNFTNVLVKRARIVHLWQKGTAVRTISRKTGASITTVYRWIRRWQEEGTLKTRPYRKRPRAATWQREIAAAASSLSSTYSGKPSKRDWSTELCSARLLNPYSSTRQLHSLLSIYYDFCNFYYTNNTLGAFLLHRQKLLYK